MRLVRILFFETMRKVREERDKSVSKGLCVSSCKIELNLSFAVFFNVSIKVLFFCCISIVCMFVFNQKKTFTTAIQQQKTKQKT